MAQDAAAIAQQLAARLQQRHRQAGQVDLDQPVRPAQPFEGDDYAECTTLRCAVVQDGFHVYASLFLLGMRHCPANIGQYPP
jgi:hypothetical protein